MHVRMARLVHVIELKGKAVSTLETDWRRWEMGMQHTGWKGHADSHC